MSRLKAFVLVAGGIAALCVMDALVKWLALRHGAPLTTFGRYASGTLIALLVWVQQGRPMLAAGGLKLHLLRGSLIAVMALCFFWSITILPLTLALTLAFVGPLTVPPMAALMLHEPMQRRYVIGGLAGFAGVAVAAGGVPTFSGTNLLAVLAAVVAAILYGASAVIMRARAAADGATAITLMAALVPFVILSPVAVQAAMAGTGLPSAVDLGLMLGTGLVGNIGVQLMARGYVHLEAQASALMEYTALPWAALLGWMVFAEPVAPATLAGAVIIAGACLWATRTGAGAAPPAPANAP